MASTWGAFLGWVVASCGAVLAAAFTAVLIIDPYGYLGLRGNHEVEILPERLITAVRASDQSFDSAIIGNSVSVPLLPADLSRLTGAKFVSLSLSGSGPKAQIAVLDFFFRRHRSVRNIVIGMDDSWCYASRSTFREWRPFPFWLYGGLAGYMAGLARNTSMALLLSPFEPRERDYIDNRQFFPMAGMSKYEDVDWVTKSLARARPTEAENATHQYPAIDALLSQIRRSSTYALVWTPRYINFIPKRDSAAAAMDSECKSGLAAGVAALPNVRVLDWSGDDRPDNHDPMNFYDLIHYRAPLAHRVEADIARTLEVLAGERR